MKEGRKRVIIENVMPEIDGGEFPIKRVVGEKVSVKADIFSDGHDSVSARLLYRKNGDAVWTEVPMVFIENDLWEGEFGVNEIGIFYYTIEGWVEHFITWRKDFKKKFEAGQDLKLELLIGIGHIRDASDRAEEGDRKKFENIIASLKNVQNMEDAVDVIFGDMLSHLIEKYPDRRFSTRYGKELTVVVDRKKAIFSSWYEFFPRSFSSGIDKHGAFKDCESAIPEIAKMGFDVLYFPPIHPIGVSKRKGKNNLPIGSQDDVGSPWAIGSKEGGHKAVHPELGTLEDFERLIKKAGEFGMEVAIDLAFQCSPDHPYVKSRPGWFKWRPDGSVQYAENPPKKYEDVLPLNFETEEWDELWEELRSIVIFWIEKGIKLFRVDNPHTKPFSFWEWLIKDIKKIFPDVIFLSEAFTRPKVMYRLAKIGFTQSYTYFTWRNTKSEFMEYLTELTQTKVREYFRPNFWPNTPDILPEHLQYGGRPAFIMRLVLASTLSSNYGIYGPAFELCIGEAVTGKEEYLNSEKYELKKWNYDIEGNLRDFVARINRIRRENPALQETYNLRFYEVGSDYILFYGKATEDLSNIILVAVNLDPYHVQSGFVKVPINDFGIDPNQPYLVHDLLSDDKYIWQGDRNYIELNPHTLPASVFRLRKRLKRETDFDYFV